MRILPADLPETDYLTVRYRADLNLLVGRWQRPLEAGEFQQGYRTLLRAAQETSCPFWLLDMRGLALPDATALQWFWQEFFPRLTEHIGRPACLGFIVSPKQLRQRVPIAEEGACMAFFEEEGPLTAWLTQCQHRSRVALAQAGFMPPPAA